MAPELDTDIARAAEILRGGGTVAFPTETVYGLGANALDPAAIARIFAAKQRPPWDPLIVHVADAAMLTQVGKASPLSQRLIDVFWPGPLTLLLPRTPAIPDAVTAGRPLVGVRMPSHPVALALIRAAGVPVAAPSANRFGHTSPTSAQHVLDDLDGRIGAVLDGGPTQVGLESTVIGLEHDDEMGDWVQIYRPGAVTIGDLELIVGAGGAQLYRPPNRSAEPVEGLPSPGVGLRHYAPNARLILVQLPDKDRAPIELRLVHAIDEAFELDRKLGVMLPDGWNASCAHLTYRWGAWGAPDELASRLFAGLRQLDDAGADVIVCPVPQGGGIAEAIRDRIEKAARPR
jgi:L-threonylcarbamoyladenylate synthase